MKDKLASVRQAIDWTVKNCPNAPYVPVKREVLESLEAKLEKAREALEMISRDGVGLQGIQEDHPDQNAYHYHAMKYFQEGLTARRMAALQALKEISQ